MVNLVTKTYALCVMGSDKLEPAVQRHYHLGLGHSY